MTKTFQNAATADLFADEMRAQGYRVRVTNSFNGYKLVNGRRIPQAVVRVTYNPKSA